MFTCKRQINSLHREAKQMDSTKFHARLNLNGFKLVT